MKIVLISPIFFDLGISTLAPLLKRDGHDVKLLFIPRLLQEGLPNLSQKMTNDIAGFIGGADMVGINSFSENHARMAILADSLRKATGTTLVWGGIHATLSPEECISHADIVCVGEGEKALLELAKRFKNNGGLKDIRNLLFRSETGTKRNLDLYPLVDLDELLPLDYDLGTQYIVEGNRIRNVKELDFRGIFTTYTNRGCPFRCSYCCSEAVHGIYKGQEVCRQRNIDNVIADLKTIKDRFSSCRHIWFNEADFIIGKTQKDVERFSERYNTEIGIPFSIWSNPAALTDGCVKALKGAGLVSINIGTINGSERIQHLIYKRNAPAALYLDKAEILNKHHISVEYDLILSNPYENDDDIISTIKLLMQLPKPFKIFIYYLTYFPKTELYETALKDGKINARELIKGYTKATYRVWKSGGSTYLNIVASLMRGDAKRFNFLKMNCYGVLPEPILKLLINKTVIKISKTIPFRDKVYQATGNLIMFAWIIMQGALSLWKSFTRNR